MVKKDLRKDIIKALEGKMKIERKIHKGWEEWEKMRKNNPSLQNKHGMVGKWQYIFKSNKGEVSLIQLLNYWGQGENLWEIYSNGTLFQDVERFKTKKKAEKRIRKLLEKMKTEGNG